MVKMGKEWNGKGPKHNMAKPRSNGIFKVAGMKFKNDKKGKPKEVTSNIKLVNTVLGWSNTLKFIYIRFLTIIPRK